MQKQSRGFWRRFAYRLTQARLRLCTQLLQPPPRRRRPPCVPLARCAASRYVRSRSIIVLLPKEWVLHDGGC